MKILTLDIETAPNLAHVWQFYNTNVGPNQVMDHCHILSWAAKWLDDDFVHYEDISKQSEKKMLKKLNVLLDECDAIVGHNAKKFDMPKIRGRSMLHGLQPASPYKEIDTCRIARREFGFDANSLKYLASVLGLEQQKSSHQSFVGHDLWTGCLNNDPEAWAEMKAYNMQDVIVTEELYLKIRGYDRLHPNVAVYAESEEILCPKCGSGNTIKQGFAYTNVSKFQQYQCKDCGGWHRSRTTEYPKELSKSLLVNAI